MLGSRYQRKGFLPATFLVRACSFRLIALQKLPDTLDESGFRRGREEIVLCL